MPCPEASRAAPGCVSVELVGEPGELLERVAHSRVSIADATAEPGRLIGGTVALGDRCCMTFRSLCHQAAACDGTRYIGHAPQTHSPLVSQTASACRRRSRSHSKAASGPSIRRAAGRIVGTVLLDRHHVVAKDEIQLSRLGVIDRRIPRSGSAGRRSEPPEASPSERLRPRRGRRMPAGSEVRDRSEHCGRRRKGVSQLRSLRAEHKRDPSDLQ